MHNEDNSRRRYFTRAEVRIAKSTKSDQLRDYALVIQQLNFSVALRDGFSCSADFWDNKLQNKVDISDDRHNNRMVQNCWNSPTNERKISESSCYDTTNHRSKVSEEIDESEGLHQESNFDPAEKNH